MFSGTDEVESVRIRYGFVLSKIMELILMVLGICDCTSYFYYNMVCCECISPEGKVPLQSSVGNKQENLLRIRLLTELLPIKLSTRMHQSLISEVTYWYDILSSQSESIKELTTCDKIEMSFSNIGRWPHGKLLWVILVIVDHSQPDRRQDL